MKTAPLIGVSLAYVSEYSQVLEKLGKYIASFA